MSHTPNKEKKIKQLIDGWNKFKTMSQEDIGEELGITGRTVYEWRRKLASKGIKLEYETDTSDNSIFDKFSSKKN